MMSYLSVPDAWLAFVQIIVIDLLLGGDNAVVIALACRKLPVAMRNRAIMGGALGAIVLRIVMLFFALQLLELPYVKIIGGVLLLWIGIKLLTPESENTDDDVKSSPRLWGAIKTIIVADAVMSLDNVVAVAGASGGKLELVIIGVVISIPIVIWGSKLILSVMDRFPIIIYLGAGLLGWIAAVMVLSDASMPTLSAWSRFMVGAAGAGFVVVTGSFMARRKLCTNNDA